ncbi:doublecortin domain containing 5, partial [Cichlidogyrus casuarinus]
LLGIGKRIYGSLGRLGDGAVDLSASEYKSSLSEWTAELNSVSGQFSAGNAAAEVFKTLGKKLCRCGSNKSYSVQLVAGRAHSLNVLVHLNGQARLNPPAHVTCSSLDNLMECCATEMHLEWKPSKLFMEDGSTITSREDLADWYDANRDLVARRESQWEKANKSQVTPNNRILAANSGNQQIVQLHKRILDEFEGGKQLEREGSPRIKISSDGAFFLIASNLDKPTKLHKFDLRIELQSLLDLKDLAPEDDTHTGLYTLGYEIFENTILTDLFDHNGTLNDEQTEIRIHASQKDIKVYFSQILKAINLLMYPVKKPSRAGETKIQLGYAIAEGEIRLDTLEPNCGTNVQVIQLYSRSSSSDVMGTVTSKLILKDIGPVSMPDEDESEDNFQLQSVSTNGDASNYQLTSQKLAYTWSPLIEVWLGSDDRDFVPFEVVYKEYRKHILAALVAKELDKQAVEEITGKPKTIPVVDTQNSRENTYTNKSERDKEPFKTPRPVLYRQPILKCVRAYANGESKPHANNVLVWGQTVAEIAENAKMRLGLNRRPKGLYSTLGNRIENMQELSRNQLVCVIQQGEEFMPPNAQKQVIEMRANWSRAYKMHGIEATELAIETRPNPFVGVDAFGPSRYATETNKAKSTIVVSGLPTTC